MSVDRMDRMYCRVAFDPRSDLDHLSGQTCLPGGFLGHPSAGHRHKMKQTKENSVGLPALLSHLRLFPHTTVIVVGVRTIEYTV